MFNAHAPQAGLDETLRCNFGKIWIKSENSYGRENIYRRGLNGHVGKDNGWYEC